MPKSHIGFRTEGSSGMVAVPQIASIENMKDMAIGIGITLTLFYLTLYSPILGFLCIVCIPLPTLYYRAKLGRKNGLLVPILAIFALVLSLGGWSLDIVYFLELTFIGFILYEFFELRLSIEKTLSFTCIAVLFAGALFVFLYSVASSTGVQTLVAEYIRENLEATVALYRDIGMSEDNVRMITDSLDRIQAVFVRILPALLIVSTLFLSWVNLLIARPLLRSRNLDYPDFGRLNRWKAPEVLVWFVIGSGLMVLVPASAIRFMGLNALLVMMTIYFFQGIAIVAYWFDKKEFPRFLRVLIYSLIALQQILALVVVCMGFFDMWLNFRRLEPENRRPQ
jgi:uncharacterized protein YybS (DUF2232 family)